MGYILVSWVSFPASSASEKGAIIQPVSTLRSGDTKLVPRAPANLALEEQE